MKRALAELWFKRTKVQFGNYQTVKQAEIAQLLDELPNKFGKKSPELPQRSTYKPESKDGEDIQSLEARLLKWKSGFNDRAQVVEKYRDKKWGRKLDLVSHSYNNFPLPSLYLLLIEENSF